MHSKSNISWLSSTSGLGCERFVFPLFLVLELSASFVLSCWILADAGRWYVLRLLIVMPMHKDTVKLTRFRESVVSALGIVNRESTSDEHHDTRTDSAAMSTLMRTLRNLRKVGIKVHSIHSIHCCRSTNE
jgi:hypothetical protein